MAGLFAGIVGLIFFVIGLGLFAFWIWMIVDVIKNQNIQGTEKIVWALVVILLHCLGALIYFLAGRKRAPA